MFAISENALAVDVMELPDQVAYPKRPDDTPLSRTRVRDTDLNSHPVTQPTSRPAEEARPSLSHGLSPAVRPELINTMIDLHPGGLTWRRTFPGTLDQIPQARRFVRFLLADSPTQEDAELIASELSTNAIRHTSSGGPHGTFIVEVTRTVTTVRIAVYDSGWGGIPKFAKHPTRRPTTESGRGLAIVSALATETGYEGTDDIGHMVWATLPAI